MADKAEILDFISVSRIILRAKVSNEDFERLMREEVFHILGADMVFRDDSRVGDNKLYVTADEGNTREYLWTTSYFRSQLMGSAGPNLTGAQIHFEELCEDAQRKMKKFGKLTRLGILSMAQGT